MHAKRHGGADSESQCMGSSSSSVRGLGIDVFEHSSRESSVRDTHQPFFERSRRNWTQRPTVSGCWKHGPVVRAGVGRQALRHRRGCHSRMPDKDGVTLRCGPTGLMLGGGTDQRQAEAADLLRACVPASSAYQLADTLQRAGEEREVRSLGKTRW